MKVTIVIPVFNTEDYLPGCLASLQDQTRRDFDVVVVDDGSEQDVARVVRPFKTANFPVECVRHSSNRGTLAGRLTGIDRARGDYVGFLDPDDIARPDFVERLLETAEKTGADIVGSTAPWTDKGMHFTLSGADQILRAYADRTICNWNVWTKFYRKAFISKLSGSSLGGIDRTDACEDVIFNIFCALMGPTYVHIPDVLVQYNSTRQGSAWNPISYEKKRGALMDTMLALETISEATPNHKDSITTITEIIARYAYQKLLFPPDREFLDWALAHIRDSPMGWLVLSAMFVQTVKDLTSKEEVLVSYREKLASKQEQLNRTRERLSQEGQRRQRLRPILGDLWRWSLSALSRRS